MFAIGDEAPDIAKALEGPLLAIGGDYDWNVPPGEVVGWGATFGEAPNPAHQTTVVPCVTHALNCVSQPDFRRVTPEDIGDTIHAPLVERIEIFLAGALR